MSITKERTQELIKEFGGSEKDTGKTEVQVAILTERINNLAAHLKSNNKKDFQTLRGLLRLVHKRRKLLKYLTKQSAERYENVRQKLGLRK